MKFSIWYGNFKWYTWSIDIAWKVDFSHNCGYPVNFLIIKTVFYYVLNCAKMYLTSLIGWFTYPQHSISVVRLYIRKSAYIFSKLIYLNASKRIQFKITLFWFNKKTLLCCRFSMNFPLNRENSFKRPNILIILWFVQFDVCKNKLPRFLYMVRVFLASFIKYPP